MHHFVVLSVAAATMTVALKTAAIGPKGVCDGCGSNTATVDDGVVFDEIGFVRDTSRHQGPKLVDARFHGESVGIWVDKGELFVDVDRGAFRLEKSEIEGLVITIEATREEYKGRQYELEFRDYKPVRFWAPPHEAVPAYEVWVKSKDSPDDPTRLCTGQFLDPISKKLLKDPKNGVYLEGMEFTALVFEGDRYGARNVVTDEGGLWFNLACQGTAAAKMHLTRHTNAGARGSDRTTPVERTAMLRAITADYCGNGRSWTGEGTPLWWTDRRGLFPLGVQREQAPSARPPTAAQIEAVWGRGGELLCLNEPRRRPSADTHSAEPCTAPAVTRDAVTQGCEQPGFWRLLRQLFDKGRIPDCSAFQGTDAKGNEFWPFDPNGETPSEFPTAYAITINWVGYDHGHGNYCNPKGGQISWPP